MMVVWWRVAPTWFWRLSGALGVVGFMAFWGGLRGAVISDGEAGGCLSATRRPRAAVACLYLITAVQAKNGTATGSNFRNAVLPIHIATRRSALGLHCASL